MKTHAWASAVALVLLLTLTLLWPRSATAAILTVTSCADSGPTTLRGQVAAASAGDTILLPACTITLASSVTISTSLTLSGEGAAATAISGGGVTQVLVVNGGTVVTISGVTIRGGMATSFGGGVANNGTLTLLNSVVTGNTTTVPGGGLYSLGTLTLLNSTVSGNTATNGGGGIENNGTLTLLNSAVSGNTTPSGAGGGIENFAGNLTLLNSTVSGNTASGPIGGGGLAIFGTATLLNSTVSGNTATPSGGGGGGGLLVSSGTLTLLNSTVTGNTAQVGGGLDLVGGAMALKNTIVAHNSAPTGANCSGGAVSSQGHNLDSDGSCGLVASGDLSAVDPQLGPLQNNGGPTQTQALLPGSPAIDAGDPVGCPPTDQRGTVRPQHGVCDIGAFEAETAFRGGSLSISPPSGSYLSTQGFDLVLAINAIGRTIVGGQVTVDGTDVTAAVARCVVPGTLVTGGFTARCPNLRGGLFPPGPHSVAVLLNLNDGTTLSDSVVWEVDANTEP
jgi:hypothetical protein